MNGVMYQLKQEKISCSSAVIANIGTGTSIHIMQWARHSRIGGTGIGGGTLTGLGMALTGITNYLDIIEISKKGNRTFIDVL